MYLQNKNTFVGKNWNQRKKKKEKKTFHLTISLVLEKRTYSTTFQARFMCVRSLACTKPFAVCIPNSSCCQATTSFGQKQVVHVLLTLGTSRLLRSATTSQAFALQHKVVFTKHGRKVLKQLDAWKNLQICLHLVKKKNEERKKKNKISSFRFLCIAERSFS